MITDIIKKTISSHKLISRGDKVLVGLSGGADSVCLTHTLFKIKEALGITLYTAHLNHGIRGEEAIRDEEFARKFSKSLGIECFVSCADIPALAKENGISEEAAGRQARYDFFKKLCDIHGIDKIATAHNKNDNAETILMNFMRGSSVKGLCGIPYTRGNIIRPLLDVSRAQIEEYCGHSKLVYMTDSTNSTLLYTRNKIRHTLIPLIQKDFNANFISTITANAAIISDDSAYLEKQAEEAYTSLTDGTAVPIDGLLKLDTALRRRVIRNMVKNARKSLEDIPSVYISDTLALLDKSSGASVNLCDGITARNEYGRLIVEREKQKAQPFEYKIAIGEATAIPEISKTVIVSDADNRKNDGAIYLSCCADSVIIIRSRREGDIFHPYGMTGSKKIKEYFINEKIPRDMRNTVPIIEIDGKIAAVGTRVDQNFLFKDRGIKIEFKSIQEVTV